MGSELTAIGKAAFSVRRSIAVLAAGSVVLAVPAGAAASRVWPVPRAGCASNMSGGVAGGQANAASGPCFTPPAGSLFGVAVAISGGLALAGAPHADHDRGNVYVFVRSGSRWRLAQTLFGPPPAKGQSYGGFGSALAVRGSVVVVGSNQRVFVYERTGSRLSRQVVLAPAKLPKLSLFGFSVAMWGTTLAVGDDNFGHVYIYVKSSATWKLQEMLSGSANTGFGVSLALWGDRSATWGVIGAENSALGEFRTHVLVYRRAAGSTRWVRQADKTAAPAAYLGTSVAIAGSSVVAGAPPAFSAGRAYTYRRSGSRWLAGPRLAPVPRVKRDDGFGTSVAISGSRVLAGAPFSGGGTGCGTAYEFTSVRGAWREAARIVDPVCVGFDAFGFALALDGTTAVVGAPGKDHDRGAVYVLTVP